MPYSNLTEDHYLLEAATLNDYDLGSHISDYLFVY